MGHLKEPKGVDFVIKSEPLTEQGRKEISLFIEKYKKRLAGKSITKRKSINNKPNVVPNK